MFLLLVPFNKSCLEMPKNNPLTLYCQHYFLARFFFVFNYVFFLLYITVFTPKNKICQFSIFENFRNMDLYDHFTSKFKISQTTYFCVYILVKVIKNKKISTKVNLTHFKVFLTLIQDF